MGARFHVKSESRKSRKSRKSHARYFGRISQSRETQKVRDFRNPTHDANFTLSLIQSLNFGHALKMDHYLTKSCGGVTKKCNSVIHGKKINTMQFTLVYKTDANRISL